MEQRHSFDQPDRLLSRDEVLVMSGFQKSHIYDLIREGRFPAPVKIGNRSRWRLGEVREWQENLPRDTGALTRPKSSPPKRRRGRPPTKS